MAKRTLASGYQAIAASNTAQPLIGTTLSAAVAASSGGDVAVRSYAVASSANFLKGDWIVIGSIAVGDEERLLIQSIPDATHIQVQKRDGDFIAHLINAFVRLSINVANYRVETKDGNAGVIFVGTQGVTTAGVNAEAKLQPVPGGQQPTAYSYGFASDAGPNPTDIGEVWVVGTAGDSYLASAGVV